MARKKLTTYFLYRRRVALAYLFIFAALAVLLTLALFIPGGLTPAERASSVSAMNNGLVSINAPYYALQKASISLLGLSTFSIKLPSVILGALLGISLFLLLRRWLTLAIAVFCALIIFSSTTYLSLAGTGSPLILYVLYPALLLFFGTRVLAHDKTIVVYALLLLITIALSLMTPSIIYLVVLALGVAAFNPHVRFGFRRLPLTGLLLLILGFIIAAAPLAALITVDPSSVRQILAIPSSFSLDELGSNLAVLGSLFSGFLQPGITNGMISPLFGLAYLGLALLGLYRNVRAIYTARAQFIIGWSVIALIIAVVDTELSILAYLPVVLLASIGLSQLAAIWYRTFPLNPYARVSALLPIGILIAGIVIGSTLRYVNTTQYATGSADLYSHDLQLLQGYLAHADLNRATLVVPDRDVAFYSNLSSPSLGTVVSLDDIAIVSGPAIATTKLSRDVAPTRILTDGRANGADRFYVYQ